MTPEQQRIAIAQFCGWSNIHQAENGDGNTLMGWWNGPPKTTLVIPNYLSDLNAMREAEHILFSSTEPLWDAFVEHLYNLGYRGSSAAKYAIHATAAQRAEAFLRTLNLWVD